jgi:hypothetical protein
MMWVTFAKVTVGCPYIFRKTRKMKRYHFFMDFLTVFPYHYSGDKIKHEMGGGMQYVWGRGEAHTGWGKLGQQDHLEKTDAGGRILK